MIFCIVSSQLPSPPPTYSRLRWGTTGARVERSVLRKVSLSPFCLGATLFNNNAPNIPASFSIIPGLLAPLFPAACIARYSQRRLLGFRDSRRLRAPGPAESNKAATQLPTPHPPSRPRFPSPQTVTCLGGVRQVVATAWEVSEFPATEA